MIKISNYGTITFNNVNLNVTSMTPIKRQKTRKQVIGKTLVESRVIGLSGQQWELQISGKVLGTTQVNLGINRAAIEALDSATSYSFVDGIHDGTYYVRPGSLQFNDTGDDAHSSYNYSMALVQE